MNDATETTAADLTTHADAMVEIAERHSGELSAWGEPDAGAVFTLILPIRQGTVI